MEGLALDGLPLHPRDAGLGEVVSGLPDIPDKWVRAQVGIVIYHLRIGPNGQRICRACNAENQRAFRSNQAVQPLSSDP